jgi:hypothetical protein
MKSPNRETVSKLEELPNVGKATADDFRLLGIDYPKQLIGKDPFELYNQLCTITKTRQDPCVIDVFISAIHFMETGEALAWWRFTQYRKDQLNRQTEK